MGREECGSLGKNQFAVALRRQQTNKKVKSGRYFLLYSVA